LKKHEVEYLHTVRYISRNFADLENGNHFLFFRLQPESW